MMPSLNSRRLADGKIMLFGDRVGLVGVRRFEAFKPRKITCQQLDVRIRERRRHLRHDCIFACAMSILIECLNEVVLVLPRQRRPGWRNADTVLAVTRYAGLRCVKIGLALAEPPPSTVVAPIDAIYAATSSMSWSDKLVACAVIVG